jgi:hypothetical protein
MIHAYFRIPILFLIFGGIPIKLQAVSTVNRIYNKVMTVCYYITFLSVVMDLVLKKGDMNESMKNIRTIFLMVFLIWLHLYLR